MRADTLRLLSGLFLCAAISAHAEGMMDRVKIRRSAIDKNIIEQPAEFFIQFPDEGDAVLSIDAGLSIDLAPPDVVDRLLLAPVVEYHRQTQTDKEQDTLQAGLTAVYQFGNVAEGAACYVQGSGKFKKDNVKNTEGTVGSVCLTPVVPAYLIGKISKRPASLPISWQPALGVEVENVADAADDGPKGTVTRGRAAIEAALYPFDSLLHGNKQFEVTVAFTHWQDVDESAALDSGDDTHELFVASAVYYLNAERNIGMGVDFKDGENPSEGMADQRLVQAVLKVKY